MLKHGGPANPANPSTRPLLPLVSSKSTPFSLPINVSSSFKISKIQIERTGFFCCSARRRVRYEEEDDEEEDYGHNSEIAMLELYSESANDEVLIVRALVDDQEEEVLIFKGISSSLSNRTAPSLSRSVLPARAIIKSIDRIKGPFDPSNIEYLEKDLAWEAFKVRIQGSKF
eukprot:TRINITY_DN6680_c0_g1_i1.p1 TRINITY_DN6680_c0_g1~~TRINITY_DN6680_c0_g1_i1.p1  ORF type:complete len:172 (-),score=40.21 TRINITY_DN6680_c0_g1_i1:338-853(-)